MSRSSSKGKLERGNSKDHLKIAPVKGDSKEVLCQRSSERSSSGNSFVVTDVAAGTSSPETGSGKVAPSLDSIKEMQLLTLGHLEALRELPRQMQQVMRMVSAIYNVSSDSASSSSANAPRSSWSERRASNAAPGMAIKKTLSMPSPKDRQDSVVSRLSSVNGLHDSGGYVEHRQSLSSRYSVDTSSRSSSFMPTSASCNSSFLPTSASGLMIGSTDSGAFRNNFMSRSSTEPSERFMDPRFSAEPHEPHSDLSSIPSGNTMGAERTPEHTEWDKSTNSEAFDLSAAISRLHSNRRASQESSHSAATDTNGSEILAVLSRSTTSSRLPLPEKARNGVLSPTAAVRLTWDTIIIMVTILGGIIAPLVVVYYDPDVPTDADDWSSYWIIMLHSMDLFWLADIGMNFRTGFFLHGDVVLDPASVAANYARGWLFPDMLALWPLALTSTRSYAYYVACVLKFPRLMQLGPRFMALQSGTLSNRLLPVSLVVVASLATHMLACLWRLAVYFGDEDTDDSVSKKYVEDLYFVSTTLTSVGYGDITPGSSIGQVCSIFLMLLGSAAFGALVSGSSILFQELMNDELSNKIAEISRFMQQHRVPAKIQRRVRDNLRQCISQAKSSCAIPLHVLENLSPSTRSELSLNLVSDVYFQFPLLKNTQDSFVAELAQAQHWEQVLLGDLVGDEGQAVKEVIFVMGGALQATFSEFVHGELDMNVHDLNAMDLNDHNRSGGAGFGRTSENSPHILTMSDDIISELYLPKGAWIGETSLMCENRVYTSVITVVNKSELSILPARDYIRVVQSFPRLLERHTSLKRDIAAGSKKITDLRYEKYREQVYFSSNGANHKWKGFTTFAEKMWGDPQKSANIAVVPVESP